MGGHIQHSHRLLTKYGRREFTDKLLIFLALVLFFGTVLYIMKKRIWPSWWMGSYMDFFFFVLIETQWCSVIFQRKCVHASFCQASYIIHSRVKFSVGDLGNELVASKEHWDAPWCLPEDTKVMAFVFWIQAVQCLNTLFSHKRLRIAFPETLAVAELHHPPVFFWWITYAIPPCAQFVSAI